MPRPRSSEGEGVREETVERKGLDWGAGKQQGRRRDSNPGPAVLGVPPPAPFAFSSLLSHRLKGEKQNLDAAMSRIQ